MCMCVCICMFVCVVSEERRAKAYIYHFQNNRSKLGFNQAAKCLTWCLWIGFDRSCSEIQFETGERVSEINVTVGRAMRQRSVSPTSKANTDTTSLTKRTHVYIHTHRHTPAQIENNRQLTSCFRKSEPGRESCKICVFVCRGVHVHACVCMCVCVCVHVRCVCCV